MKRRLPILLLAAGLALAAFRFFRHSPELPRIDGRIPAVRASRVGKAADPAIAERVLALEAQRAERLATTWAPEVEAERHEEIFIRLWDMLRTEPEPWAALAALEFDTLELPSALGVSAVFPGVRRFVPAGPPEVLDRSAWLRRLGRWRAAGWRLDGSEWRMPRFIPATRGAPAGSGFVLELHLEQPEEARRVQLRAELDVVWAAGAPAEEPPVPSRLTVRSLSALERLGPPAFELVARDDVQPPPGASTIDPLLVQDLDGDGLDEIVLLGKNRVYLNRGGGRLQGVRLAPRLDSQLVAGLFADIDGDGRADLVGADARGLAVLRGAGTALFDVVPEVQPLPEIRNPWVLAAGDVDGDGDLDLWLAQYKVPYFKGQMPAPYHDAVDGFPSYLLRNDGAGRFTDVTAEAGLTSRRFRRTYSASFVDLDGDGDLDLVNVSDFAGVDLYLNDGHGRFADATAALAEPKLFGMAHAVADFDDDGRPDLLAIGMDSAVADRLEGLGLGLPGHAALTRWRAAMSHGNRLWLNRGGGTFAAVPDPGALRRTGWSWGVAVQDYDNDGIPEVHVVNGHKSLASARDYDTEFWTADIYHGLAATADPALDAYFQGIAGQRYGRGDSYGGHQRNRFLRRAADGAWYDVAWLVGLASSQDCRNLAAADLDGDGRLDTVMTTARHVAPVGQGIEVHRGVGEAGRWAALRVPERGGGVTPHGAHVVLETDRGRRHRWLMSGDSYRTQNWPVAWFGLGPGETPRRFSVEFPGGRTRSLENPPLNRLSVLP